MQVSKPKPATTSKPRRKPNEPAIAPFTVAIDTREQAPFPFVNIPGDSRDRSPTIVVPTIMTTLRTGDYSIVGMESIVCVERKSHEDLYQTLIYDWDRFARELERMRDYKFSAVVIESDWKTIATPPGQSRANPKSVIRRIYSAMLDFPSTQWLLMPDRRVAEITTFQLLRKFHDRYEHFNGGCDADNREENGRLQDAEKKDADLDPTMNPIGKEVITNVDIFAGH